MVWESLPFLDGWEYKDIPLETLILAPGTVKDIIDRRMSGWGIDITVLTDNPYLKILVREDFVEHLFTPFALFVGGLTKEYPGFWLSKYDPVNGLYQVVIHDEPPPSFRGLWSVKLTAPDINPVLGGAIVTNTTILGGQVVWIEITDEIAFKKSLRELYSGPVRIPSEGKGELE